MASAPTGRGEFARLSEPFGRVGHVVLRQALQLVVIEPQIDGRDGVSQVLRVRHSDDRRRHRRLVEHPGKRDLSA